MPETGNLSQHLLSKKELAALCVTSSFYVSGGNRTHIRRLGDYRHTVKHRKDGLLRSGKSLSLILSLE